MKHLAFPFLTVLLAASCSNAIKDSSQKPKEEPLQDSSPKIIVYAQPPAVTNNLSIVAKEDLYGFWVGMFEPDLGATGNNKAHIRDSEKIFWDKSNKITIAIDSMADDSSVYGHSVVAGNFRPFKGKYRYNGSLYTFEVSEPGDDKYDGAFSFSIKTGEDHIAGHWASYKPVEISKRKYSLSKKLFVYDPNAPLEDVYLDWEQSRTTKNSYEGQVFYDKTYFSTTERIFETNPSVTLLKAADIENFTKADIYILRNSIYAKHGYSFKKRALRVFFDSHDWYMPVYIDIKKELTDIEKANIKLLMRYEKNAEEYYDTFGRG